MFIQNKLTQKLTVFSDGSFLLELSKTNYSKKLIDYLRKDLKTFQKASLNNSVKLNRISKYRKKYF